MLRYMDDRCTATEANLIYSVRTRQDILFEKELRELSWRLPKFRYVATVTKPDPDWTGPSGRLSRELITAHVRDVASAVFFLCGPEAFMQSAQEILKSLGVEPTRIKRESFGGQEAEADRTVAAWVEFAHARKSCDIPPGATLLEAAEGCGVAIPNDCRQGQCGTCKARLLEGEVRMDAEDGLDPALKAQGYVLTCVGRAQGQMRRRRADRARNRAVAA